MTITKRTKIVWVTPDGVEHLSKAMAEQHEATKALLEILDGRAFDDGHDILNALSSPHHRRLLQSWITATTAMEKFHNG